MWTLDQLCIKLGRVWSTLSSSNALENEPPIAMSLEYGNLEVICNKRVSSLFNIGVLDWVICAKA